MVGKVAVVAYGLFALSYGVVLPSVFNETFVLTSATTKGDSTLIESKTVVVPVPETLILPTSVTRGDKALTELPDVFVSLQRTIAPTTRVPVEWISYTTVTGIEPSSTTLREPIPACGRLGRDLINSCLKQTCDRHHCHEDDAQCLCLKFKEEAVCFDTCPFDYRYASILEERNKFCNKSPSEPTPIRQPPVLETKTLVAVKTHERLMVTEEYELVPTRTDIVYPHRTLHPWIGVAGHTHYPSLRRKLVDGRVVLTTMNARPTNAAAAGPKAPGLAAVVGGAIGVMAALV